MLVVRLVGLGHQVGVGIWMSWSGIKVPSLPGGVDGRQRQACDVQQMEIPMLKRGKKSSHQVSLARVSTRMGRTDGMAGRESRGRRPSIWRKRSSSASWTGSGAASPSIPGVDLQEQAKIQNIYICVFLDVHLTSCLTSLLYIVGGAAEKVIGPVDEFIGLVTSVIVTTSSLSSSPSRSASPPLLRDTLPVSATRALSTFSSGCISQPAHRSRTFLSIHLQAQAGRSRGQTPPARLPALQLPPSIFSLLNLTSSPS